MELSKMIEASNTYNISTEEFIVLYMIFLSQIDEKDGLGRKELLQLYKQNDNNAETLEKTIQSLKDKNIIKKDFNYVKGKTNPSNIPLRQNVINQLFKHSGELGEELWDAYPDYTISDGRRYTWKNIGKRFNSMDDFYYFYGKQINHSPEKHREVLDILKWMKENGKIMCGIAEFVISHKWEEWKNLRDSGGTDLELASTFDVYESI